MGTIPKLFEEEKTGPYDIALCKLKEDAVLIFIQNFMKMMNL